MGFQVVKLVDSLSPVIITGGLNPTGAWSSATTYNKGDSVSLSGTSYVCITSNTNQTPPNVTYWQVLASIGATGSTGATGATGAGVPVSGTTGQILKKNSATDYDTGWETIATVATSGSYTDLTSIPTSFTPAAHASTHEPGGSDDIFVPNWRRKGASLFFQANNITNYDAGSLAFTNNYVLFQPWDNPFSVTIDEWALIAMVQGVGGTQQAYIALYDLDSNNMPNAPILSLDTYANYLDLTTLTGGLYTLQSATLSQSVTIPAGQYYIATRFVRSGTISTWAANCYYLGGDPRLAATNIINQASGSAYYNISGTFGTSPTLNANLYVAPRVYFRQTA